ncbi:hypothetical protein B0J11DRAFT_597879 [Dendryphion nanum]|uniref:Serine protease n=1 Tax=Dendryphion nanum TaxID=256645 RepID=A0A9P9D4M4_9PLEO|nr:hypothetical protein B0J11DRAFT_597879 [Dendryphion nanum]
MPAETHAAPEGSLKPPVLGTGFLVNIPFTKKYCVITAGHNVARPNEGRANRVEVSFPGGFTFTAQASELFVSRVYGAKPTLSDGDPSSLSDYALIAVDRAKHAPPQSPLGGCSLSILPSRSELLHTGGTVYGYNPSAGIQSKETSPFLRPVKADVLEYEKNTQPGVSGGPIFVSYKAGNMRREAAIGIHNYHGRATRITMTVMLEILSWIDDYGVMRTFEDANRPGVYFQSTTGTSPRLVGRPGPSPNAVFKLVPVYIAKESSGDEEDPESEHGFALLAAHNKPEKAGMHYFVSIEEGKREEGYRVCLREDNVPQRSTTLCMWDREPAKTLALMTDSTAMLSITPTDRMPCECGCITKDDMVEVVDLDETEFLISKV